MLRVAVMHALVNLERQQHSRGGELAVLGDGLEEQLFGLGNVA